MHLTLPKSDQAFRYFKSEFLTTQSAHFFCRDLFKNQNQMRRYASSVLRCLLSKYGVNIGAGTFYFWLTKFPVSQFDPAVQVFIDTLLTIKLANPSKEILKSSGQYSDTICLENFYKWREFRTHTVNNGIMIFLESYLSLCSYYRFSQKESIRSQGKSVFLIIIRF